MHRLGQHFLKNRGVIKAIVAALEITPKDTIIEIGSGLGTLTFPLADACARLGCRLIAIEKDKKLFEELVTKKKELGKSEIVCGDALTLINSFTHELENWKLVGNIPYYITGRLLRTIGESKRKPILSILMLQREVAERISAAPPRMNLLAAATQIWAAPHIIARLTPQDFSPPPKISSAVIALETRRAPQLEGADLKNYYRFIRALFKQPRKTVWNNLRAGLSISETALARLLNEAHISKNARPQDIPLSVLIKLTAESQSPVL